jgi:glycosyltransferase involved in cell wall biosynthesis
MCHREAGTKCRELPTSPHPRLMSELVGTRSPQSTAAPGPALLTVASVPASHVYVRHIAAESGDGVVRLPDPDPDTPERSSQQRWWPPVMLHPDWISTHDFDVFHIHFGFDAWSPAELRRVVDTVHARGRAVVYTAHDLRNPHHRSSAAHDAQLEVLMKYADAVITLTDGAAAEIESRWDRRARVLPHPHVVDLETMTRRAGTARATETRSWTRAAPFRVGLHLKSLRASMDPASVLPTLVQAAAGLPDAVLQVNGHCDVLSEEGARYDAGLASYLRHAEARGELELHVHDFMSDVELWSYLASLDVSVLAYRFGTHSGWLEACRDLGTAVVAPTCGYYADQGPVESYVLDEERFDPDSLVAAIRAAHAAGPVAPVPVDERRAQRAYVAAAHRRIYESLT